MSEKIRYTDEELDEFREIVAHKLSEAKQEYERYMNILMNKDGNDVDDTSPTYKLTEEGADTFNRELTMQFANRQLKLVQSLQAAMVRIENKTYGICCVSGKLIPKERLKAVPHATMCIEAKKAQPK
ncbi:MAG: TraR/DksA family transcriptional regulator [Bacteroidales bacterium]|nr:TraR/DksA family transcriptional regulator [Bacteroidales bacterium]